MSLNTSPPGTNSSFQFTISERSALPTPAIGVKFSCSQISQIYPIKLYFRPPSLPSSLVIDQSAGRPPAPASLKSSPGNALESAAKVNELANIKEALARESPVPYPPLKISRGYIRARGSVARQPFLDLWTFPYRTGVENVTGAPLRLPATLRLRLTLAIDRALTACDITSRLIYLANSIRSRSPDRAYL